MIKVIKHGQTEFTHTCSRCGCEFTYEFEDIQVDSYSLNSTSANVVKCPDCGNTCYVNNNIGWPWPNTGEPIPCNTPSDTALNPCSTCDWWKKMQTPGFTYVGDIPCTWCNKGPYKVTCDNSLSTNATTPKLQIYNGADTAVTQLQGDGKITATCNCGSDHTCTCNSQNLSTTEAKCHCNKNDNNK